MPRSLYPEFVATVYPRVQSLRLGTDVGCLISKAPVEKLQRILAAAVKDGAKVLVGGKPRSDIEAHKGSYFEPTIVVDVTMDMEIAKEELFAPVMTVVPYDTVDEAVEWLNKGRFGLGASVWGSNRAQARMVAGKLQCGMVAINE